MPDPPGRKRKAPAKKPAKKAPAKRPAKAAPPPPPKDDPPPAADGLVARVQALIEHRRSTGSDDDGIVTWGDREEALAELALALARKLPSADLATAAVARELRATLDALAPKEITGDALDFLKDSATPVGDTPQS